MKKNKLEKRKRQIIKSFEKSRIMSEGSYAKKEVETEVRKFQDMIVSQVFEDKHGEHMRISDVQSHINALAEKYGIANHEKIRIFNTMSDELSRLISSEIAGNIGERKMIHNLEMIQVENKYLTNIELSMDDFISELDGIVVTSKAIFLIEAKYSVNDMCITREGNYCRLDNPTNIYCNIGDKINEKQYLLRQFLLQKGFSKQIKIYRIIVYTNNNSKLTNNYRYVKKCTCNQLHYFIEGFTGDDIYSTEDMLFIQECLTGANNVKKYPIGFDFKMYVSVFADALIMIEQASSEDKNSISKEENYINWKSIVRCGTVAVAAAAVVTVKVINRVI